MRDGIEHLVTRTKIDINGFKLSYPLLWTTSVALSIPGANELFGSQSSIQQSVIDISTTPFRYAASRIE